MKKLIDSNIIIYSAHPSNSFLREMIAAEAPFVSAISMLEVLGYHKLSTVEKKYLTAFFDEAVVIDISRDVINRAITLRQSKILSLADSIIAATSLIYNLELNTRNTADFTNIKGLKINNPFK